MSELLILMILTPLATAFLLSLTAIPHKVTHEMLTKVRTIFSLSGLSILSGLLILAGSDILSGTVYTYNLGGWSPFVGITLQLDALSYVIAVVAVFICFLGMIYSVFYMEHIRGMGKYDTFYFLTITGILGVLLSRDLFNMYVFFEVLNVSVYVLIVTGEKKENYKASLQYLILGSLSSALFLLAVGIIYATCGSLNMDYAAQSMIAALQENPSLGYTVFSLIVVSLGLKSSIVLLHFWLPDAHSIAPSPVSALQSGVILKIGVYAMIRLFSLFDFQSYGEIAPLLTYVGVITVVVGTLSALVQKDLKRMLAYSTISQIGIILTGVGIGNDLAVQGAIFHIINHAIMKSGLFLCAGILIHYSGTRYISQLGAAPPGLAISFCVLSLGIIGIPPLNGFVSKFLVCWGAFQAQYQGLAFIILAASIVSCSYYFRVVQALFGKEKKKKRARKTKISRFLTYPVYLLAILSVILGIFPLIGMKAAELAVTAAGG